MTEKKQLPGLDLERLTDWIAEAAPNLASERPLEASLVAGGRSNLTYSVTDGSRHWILRRPPLGHVLATAHDMGREYRVLSALQDTAVPVPQTYALCTDTAVLGAPFYLMEQVAGTPYRTRDELATLGADRTRRITERLVDTLAALHAVDPAAVGLSDFGKTDGFLARQVGRWKKQLDASYTRDLPAADELHQKLLGAVPSESATGIVHGDYRLDNILVDEGDRVTAVLDWEMATLGDPLTDLALMITYHRLDLMLDNGATSAASSPGFLNEAEVIARYGRGSERDLSRFGFYLGLAAFKLATILEGIHFRHLQGKTVGEGFDTIGQAIDPLLAAGLSALKETY
ncbi:phosphotransferase family protein [Nocardioides sp. CER19]|uniref:phosphotransferase family protein n=1 Tax=Nocardioides sp. CER19 TaxID=3038538 RepID=UPI002446B969|nr:phosphotransferase family protein [Nocardioides sp. CER19]MDH2416124.1 phosphotransferase family protein [Nocardioides sp. CER19]